MKDVDSGGTIGAVVSLAMSGVLASSSGGWQSVFYVPGVLGLLWTALWWWLGADSPLTHPTIDPREREYILTSLQSSNQTEVHSRLSFCVVFFRQKSTLTDVNKVQ